MYDKRDTPTKKTTSLLKMKDLRMKPNVVRLIYLGY